MKLHHDLGQNSALTIVEVAELMDIIHFGPKVLEVKQESIFFQFSNN